MQLTQIYECFCDRTRLRILHLLTRSPLCVCHFQAILNEPQVKISKHLAYLRNRGVVTTEREGNWIIYSLARSRSPQLDKNLCCLSDCLRSDPAFRRDAVRLRKLQAGCGRPHVMSDERRHRTAGRRRAESPVNRSSGA